MNNPIRNFIITSKKILNQKSFREINHIDIVEKKPNFDVLEKDFFTRLRLSNGTYKMTFNNRMNDINEYIVSAVSNNKQQLIIQDVGISSGISTKELAKALEKKKLNFNLVGGDAFLYAYYGSYLNQKINILSEENGNLLELDFFGWVCGSAQRKYGYILFFLFYPFFHLLFTINGKKIVKGKRFKRIKLVTRHLRNMPNVKIIEDDILEKKPSFDDKFHLIRAANVVNLSYFSNDQIKRIITNLSSRVMENGLLIINRTNSKKVNNGSVYKKTNNTLIKIHNFNQGSEIDFLI